jgi:hypothetical protein
VLPPGAACDLRKRSATKFLYQKHLFNMRKIYVAWALLPLLATALFFACKKTDRPAGEGDEQFNVATVQKWFETQFTQTAEYRNGTRNGADVKVPNWKKGRVYNIGQYKVAEFPLFINNRRVYVPETLADADAKRVVAGTLYKALFVQSSDGTIETRIMQFTPSYQYLSSKRFDISNLSFQNYAAEFKGDMMMFDYDNNMKKGWHFGNGKPKGIKLRTKFANGNRQRTESSGLCDNIPIEPNCYYTVHTVFEYQCSGGWNVNEGFNPDYCQISQIVSIECELEYCEEPGVDLIQECMNQGYTQAECMCQVYALGCENGGGYDEQACQQAQQECENASAFNSTTAVEDLPTSPTTKDITVKWNIAEHTLGTWRIVANTHFIYNGYYVNNTLHTHISKVETLNSSFEGSQAIIETTWIEKAKTDVILLNDAPIPKTKSTVTGDIKQKCKNVPHPLCVWLKTYDNVSNSLEPDF